jgi:hypothetical protein
LIVGRGLDRAAEIAALLHVAPMPETFAAETIGGCDSATTHQK